jgi:hypothetical protein
MSPQPQKPQKIQKAADDNTFAASVAFVAVATLRHPNDQEVSVNRRDRRRQARQFGLPPCSINALTVPPMSNCPTPGTQASSC